MSLEICIWGRAEAKGGELDLRGPGGASTTTHVTGGTHGQRAPPSVEVEKGTPFEWAILLKGIVLHRIKRVTLDI